MRDASGGGGRPRAGTRRAWVAWAGPVVAMVLLWVLISGAGTPEHLAFLHRLVLGTALLTLLITLPWRGRPAGEPRVLFATVILAAWFFLGLVASMHAPPAHFRYLGWLLLFGFVPLVGRGLARTSRLSAATPTPGLAPRPAAPPAAPGSRAGSSSPPS